MRTQLKVGQRIDIYEIIKVNPFSMIQGHEFKIGNWRSEMPNRNNLGGVWLNSKHGDCYHYPIQKQLKKVGTMIIKYLK